MGKRIIPQRRGRGSSTYRSPSHRHLGPIRYPQLQGEGIVEEIRHAPGHSAPVAKVRFADQSYLLLAPGGLEVGQKVMIGRGPPDRGNILPLREIPEGTLVFNIEAKPGDGGKFVRSAGTAALVVTQGEKTVVQLPSGRYKSFDGGCRATIGTIAGSGHREKPFGKAGKKVVSFRSKAKRSFKTSGVAMNPVDHPHGGGSHQHVGGPSTVSANAPPGRKVGRLSPKKKKKRRK